MMNMNTDSEKKDVVYGAYDADAVAVLEQRCATYGFLARLYREEIDQEFLDVMHGMLYPADAEDKDLDTGYRLIATFLSNLWSDSISELKIDFARCFLGHGVDGYSAAYPYESVYTSEKRLMMQDARDEVRRLYRKHGIEKTAAWKEGEDHLALELEFERILCGRTIEALKAGDERKAIDLLAFQQEFLKTHLLPWVPMLTADMKRYAETKMYQGLAFLTDGFLRSDAVLLDELLSDEEEGGGTQ